MAPGFKTGGRVKGSRNKAVVAREAAMAEAAKLLSASDGDKFDGDAHALLKAVYQNPVFPISLRNDAAKAALRIESPAEDESAPRYVAIMPWPVKDLDEWKQKYLEVAPNADPNEAARLEKIASVAIEDDKAMVSPKDRAPWLEEDKTSKIIEQPNQGE